MPIYEYRCKGCSKDFEVLVYGNREISCPKCSSKDLTKKLSAFGMSGVKKPFAGSSSAGCASCSKGSCSSCK